MLTLVSQDSSIVLRGREKKEEVENRPFKRSGTAESNYRYGRPNSFYAILIDSENENEVVGIEKPPQIGSDYPLSKTPEGYIRVYPISRDNGERVWRRSYESCIDLIETKKLHCSKNLSIYQIIDDEDRHSTLFTNWTDKRYNAGTYGANLLKDIIGDKNSFSYPKSIYTVEDAIYSVGSRDFWVLDYFAGSGTTAHAVLNINKDGGNLKFFLVEMGDYFDTVTKPRIKKVMYSDNWKDGKPQDMSGIGGFFKYHTLEQYEDALENVEFKQTDLSSFIQDRDVLFRYNFDYGTAESKTFLGADVENNMNFEIVTLGKNMEKVPTSVDLIESFNYIVGLWVDKYIVKEDEGRRYIALKGKVDDETVFVVWRDPSDIDYIKDRQFIEREIIVGEEYSRLYVNSDYAPEESAMQKYYNIFDEWQKRLW
jgi:adenine-specific DNA-methyltransferase